MLDRKPHRPDPGVVASVEPEAHLLPLSGRTPEALAAIVRAYGEELAAEAGEEAWALRDVCYSASVHGRHHDHRLALVVQDRQHLAEQLEAFLSFTASPPANGGRRPAGGRPKIAFVFSGQGSQWCGMGRQLMEQEEVFRRSLESCDADIRRFTDWSLLNVLGAPEPPPERVDVIQPSLWAIQVSLAALWRSWGVEPAAVVGQSMGEIAAAQVAGALSQTDAARVVCAQSRLFRRVMGQGEMALVELPPEEARELVAGYGDRLVLAIEAGLRSTVLSGDPAAVTEILEDVECRGVFGRKVQVGFACHGPQMELMRGDLRAAFEGVAPRAAAVPFYSTVEAKVTPGGELDAAYWARMLCQPVRFQTALEQLLADGLDVFVEISPHPVVLPAIGLGLAHLGRAGTVLASLRRRQPERPTMLATLGALYGLGQRIEWSGLYREPGRRVALPSVRQAALPPALGAGGERPARPAAAGGDLPGALAAAPPAQRRRQLQSKVLEQVSQVLNLAPARVALSHPLRLQGLDSFMSVELCGRLEASLRLTIPNAVIWNYPTVDALTSYLDGRFAGPAATAAVTAAESPARPAQGTALAAAIAELDQISDQEALEALLAG